MASTIATLSVDDIAVQGRNDLSTMQTHIAAQLNDRINQQIDQRLLEQVSLHLFGTSDVQVVQDVFEAVQRVPEVRDNILALRAKRRIGVA